MLKHLETIFKNFGYHIVEEVNTLKDTPCLNTTVKAINFDKVAEKFCIKYSINDSLSSIDLLFIIPAQNELHFVEMKRCSGQNSNDFWAKYYHSEKIINKNINSIFLVLTIASTYHIEKDFYQYFFDPLYANKLKIRTTIVCDLSDAEMAFMFYLTAGGSGMNFQENLRGEVNIINCNTFEKKFKDIY